MTIRYSINWMGPINKKWYEDLNLPLWTYAAGRIDCRGEGLGRYGDEIYLPPMRRDDWDCFGEWLNTFETDAMWNFKDIIELYERENPKITWAEGYE
jgi:hypothetical protein